jgi:hypothetical protein
LTEEVEDPIETLKTDGQKISFTPPIFTTLIAYDDSKRARRIEETIDCIRNPTSSTSSRLSREWLTVSP